MLTNSILSNIFTIFISDVIDAICMHIIPKIVLGFGIILFLVGIVAVIIGGATLTDMEMDPESEDYSGTLMWE